MKENKLLIEHIEEAHFDILGIPPQHRGFEVVAYMMIMWPCFVAAAFPAIPVGCWRWLQERYNGPISTQ